MSTEQKSLPVLIAGGGIGGWVAGKLADSYGWPAPFIIFAALGFVVMAILFKLLRDDAPGEVRVREEKRAEPIGLILKNPAALLLCGVFFLATAASSAVLNWCNTYAHDVLGLNLRRIAKLLGIATNQLAQQYCFLER